MTTIPAHAKNIILTALDAGAVVEARLETDDYSYPTTFWIRLRWGTDKPAPLDWHWINDRETWQYVGSIPLRSVRAYIAREREACQ